MPGNPKGTDMTQKHKRGLDAKASHQSPLSTATSLASDRCGVSRAGGGQEVAEPGASGAPPSNTAPDNCNLGEECFFKALRWGVDSLYLSYPGELSSERDAQLKELKQFAQSSHPDEIAKAQLPLGGHIFEVKEKGASLFPYILEDGAFRIQLSRPGHKAPMAYVKVSAKYLAHVGPVAAEQHLYGILAELGDIQEGANVSRIDLFVDFQSSVDMESWDRHAWVTRASAINAYAVSGQFSGWAIGMGGILSARLYNKLLEVVLKGNEWIIPLWQATGWNGEGLVWRLEFEMKREVLVQKGLSKLPEVLNHLDGLWSYATTEWLRLTLPSADDKTRSRWPIHPLWGFLSAVDWATQGGPLTRRFSPTRSPHDDKLLQMACSVLVSFAAKHGFDADQLHEAHEELIARLIERLGHQAADGGQRFEDYVDEKIALKRRQFNTGVNDPDQEAKRKAKEVAEQAKAYRKASGS